MSRCCLGEKQAPWVMYVGWAHQKASPQGLHGLDSPCCRVSHTISCLSSPTDPKMFELWLCHATSCTPAGSPHIKLPHLRQSLSWCRLLTTMLYNANVPAAWKGTMQSGRQTACPPCSATLQYNKPAGLDSITITLCHRVDALPSVLNLSVFYFKLWQDVWGLWESLRHNVTSPCESKSRLKHSGAHSIASCQTSLQCRTCTLQRFSRQAHRCACT